MRRLSENSACIRDLALPIPTRVFASEEYKPAPQSMAQRQVEQRLQALGAITARKLGISRRRFFQTASGMAASYLVMNEVHGQIFSVEKDEASDLQAAQARADGLAGQMVFDAHTHFLGESPNPQFVDATRAGSLIWQRLMVGRLGWNKALAGREPRTEDMQFTNFFKEIYLDSDTQVALLSNAPSQSMADWLLPQDEVFKTRARVNAEAGSRRMLAHFTLTPGREGWLDEVDRAAALLRPEGWKLYTIGDIILANYGRGAYRLDDEKLMYPFYEKAQKSGIRNVCVHKGLFPQQAEERLPHLAVHAAVGDVGRAAKDWPGLNFVVYHSGYRHLGGPPQLAVDEWEQRGRLSWLSDLAEIPGRFGVANVYGDLGAIFGWTVLAQPRLAAAMLGTLINGLGADHVIWGTDSIWTGSPQWQIEALRRLEIPLDMQRQHGFAPLGAADGAVKTGILGANGLSLFKYEPRAELRANDKLADLKARYQELGPRRSNMRYGHAEGDA